MTAEEPQDIDITYVRLPRQLEDSDGAVHTAAVYYAARSSEAAELTGMPGAEVIGHWQLPRPSMHHIAVQAEFVNRPQRSRIDLGVAVDGLWETGPTAGLPPADDDPPDNTT